MVSEQTISLQEAKVQEALQYDLEIPCIVQWRMLWFSAPISLNKDLLNVGTILGKFYEAVILAVLNVLGAPNFGVHTPRIFFMKAMRTILEDMPENSLEPRKRSGALVTG